MDLKRVIREIIKEELRKIIKDEALFDPDTVTITGTGTIEVEEDSEDDDDESHKHFSHQNKMKQINLDDFEYSSKHDYKDDLYMAKSQLYNLNNQSKVLFDLICNVDPDSIEPWMKSKFSKAFEAIDDVFDNLNYRSGNNKL